MVLNMRTHKRQTYLLLLEIFVCLYVEGIGQEPLLLSPFHLACVLLLAHRSGVKIWCDLDERYVKY